MGYDVSFHPISPREIDEWYFAPLEWVKSGQEQKVIQFAEERGVQPFYAQKYLDTLRVGSETEYSEPFDKSHGYYIAVVQGFFRGYYYTRGSAISFLVEEKPEYERYLTGWEELLQEPLQNKAENRIIENYCSGVYLSPEQVERLLCDLERDARVHTDFEAVFSHGRLAVLKKALSAAREIGSGLLEATEVIEPDPLRPNDSSCYSNLFNCDRDGVYLYIDAVVEQLRQINDDSE